MSRSANDPRRALVTLLPQFLPRRRAGWPGAPIQQSGLERPAFFLLIAIVRELDPGASASYDDLQANLFNPYSTIRPALDLLPALVAGGYLSQDGERYSVTPAGRELIIAAEHDVRAYVATRQYAPEDEIARLADRFEQIAGRLWAAPEPAAKPHQMRNRRLPPPEPGSAPQVHLDEAAYTLWLARDDAHNAAWRTADFDGPSFDLLSRLWAGDAATEAELVGLVKHDQRPEDVARGLARLIEAGYVARTENREQGNKGAGEQTSKGAGEQTSGVTLALTERGRAVRDAIEAETDRIYFAPWPPLYDDELAWMTAALRRIVTALGG
jgi:hypothetical protein